MKRKTKAIILCGGEATREFPATTAIPKSLLCVYDKPLCYYPISIAMITEIRDILIICTSYALPLFKKLLGDGSKFGVNFEYAVQDKANGIAEAFLIGKDFIGDDNVMLILGDNIFYGTGISKQLKTAREEIERSTSSKAIIFTYHVNDEEAKRFGIVEIDKNGTCLSIEEKPAEPKSNNASVGLYLYTNDVIKKASQLKPSERGELEITDINKLYLSENSLKAISFTRGSAWLDSGVFDTLLDSCNFIAAIEKRQGLKIACLEEIGWYNGWLTKRKLKEAGESMKKNEYGQYLLKLADKY